MLIDDDTTQPNPEPTGESGPKSKHKKATVKKSPSPTKPPHKKSGATAMDDAKSDTKTGPKASSTQQPANHVGEPLSCEELVTPIEQSKCGEVSEPRDAHSVRDIEKTNDRRSKSIKEQIHSLFTNAESAWGKMKVELAATPRTGDAQTDEQAIRDAIAEVASDHGWLVHLNSRDVELAAAAWPHPLSDLVEPTGDSHAQITKFMAFAGGVHHLVASLHEYAQSYANLAAVNGYQFPDHPEIAAARNVLEAELYIVTNRLFQRFGGRIFFDTTIKDDARKIMPKLADAKAARFGGAPT